VEACCKGCRRCRSNDDATQPRAREEAFGGNVIVPTQRGGSAGGGNH
jgi:hypothetical protein